MIVAMLSGFLSGIISGMGIGGGTILIPALTMLTDANQHIAQGVNLLYFIPTAIAALLIHKKNDTLELKTAFPIIVFGIAGAALGAFVALRLNSVLLRRLFGIFLFLMGAYEIYKGFQKNKENAETG